MDNKRKIEVIINDDLKDEFKEYSPFALTTKKYTNVERNRRDSFSERKSPIMIGNKLIHNMNSKCLRKQCKTYNDDLLINEHYLKFHDRLLAVLDDFDLTQLKEFNIYEVNIRLCLKHQSLSKFQDYLRVNNFDLIFRYLKDVNDIIVKIDDSNNENRKVIVTYGNV